MEFSVAIHAHSKKITQGFISKVIVVGVMDMLNLSFAAQFTCSICPINDGLPSFIPLLRCQMTVVPIPKSAAIFHIYMFG